MQKKRIKEVLKNHCVAFVKAKLNTIKDTITSNQEALVSESKSSAGDKHETGRAMLQLEMEKSGQQLKEVAFMQELIDKVDSDKFAALGSLGAAIETDNGNYYVSISAGKVLVNEKHYFTISPNTPIGKLLLGKKADDFFTFRGQKSKIIDVF